MSLLAGKNIVVTGASRGIGAETAKHLAQQGARVALTYSSQASKAEEVCKSLSGQGHFCTQLSLQDESSIEAAFSQISERMGSIDGLVNNAGLTRDTLLLRMKTEDFDQVINANLRGTFLCTRAAIKIMLKARKGSVVNVTSVIGQTGNAGQSNYAASKAGIVGMTKSIAQEVASRSIRLNCVAPGFIDTEMTQSLSDTQKTAILEKIPMGRMATASEVAKAVAFLLSDDASYITGHTLSVNGGMYMS